LAADLINRQVVMIVATGGDPSALAAKAATATIPIVFYSGSDPVKLGLVASLNRPGGNATGVSLLSFTLIAKQLELLCELVPTAATVAFLVNPNNSNTVNRTTEMQETARTKGRQLQTVVAGTKDELELAFAAVQGSPPTHSSPHVANSSWRWRHGMQSPPAIHGASSPRLAA
jgi:putative ABC transport system substrate-binding protein